jgi:hypothetical protein
MIMAAEVNTKILRQQVYLMLTFLRMYKLTLAILRQLLRRPNNLVFLPQIFHALPDMA